MNDISHLDPQLRKQICATVVAVVSICAQYMTVLMVNDKPKTDTARWRDNEITAFLQYLLDHRAEGGDGATFKTSTFTAAAASIAHLHQTGGNKTAEKCRGKWNSVRYLDHVN